ncbi:MAG: DUF6306 domain-containing protein [Alphaproteobacteria bacterium]
MTEPKSNPSPPAVSDDDPNSPPGSYASPPCFMHELNPAYLGYWNAAETVALLNELLEAERAGAKVATALGKTSGDAGIKTLLRGIGADEAHFCAMLRREIERLGAAPSLATGAFFDKVMAQKAVDAQVALLNKGQLWVVRRIRDALPRISDDALRSELKHMLDVHVHNIERCLRPTR